MWELSLFPRKFELADVADDGQIYSNSMKYIY